METKTAAGLPNKKLTGKNSLKDTLLSFPQLSICIAFVVLFLFLSIYTDTFFTSKNLINVLRQTSTSMVVSITMTYVLILGGIDLSVGSVACLAGTVSVGLMVKSGLPVPLALLVGLLLGILAGMVNGFFISKVKIPPFIVTLAMMSTARGLSLVYTGGRPITGIPESALYLGRGYILGIPVPVIIMAAVIIISAIVLNMTTFSRYIFAIGGNEECARLSGIKVARSKIMVYAISGLGAAVTGILLTMRLASGQPTLAEGLELDAIAAVVLGGTSLSGGKGYLFGTVMGCLFLTIMGNGFNIIGISSFWQQVFKGIIILIAVSMYEKKKK